MVSEQQFQWILYDGRADALGDTFEASVLEAFASRRDLKANLYKWFGHDGVLFEYDVDGKNLVNERRIGHLREGKAALLAKCSRNKTALDGVTK